MQNTAVFSFVSRFSRLGRGKVTSSHASAAYTRSSTVSKVVHPIVDAAERNESKVAEAFLLLIATLQKQIPLNAIEEKLATSDMNGLLQLLDIENRWQAIATGKGLYVRETSLLEALQQTFKAGAEAEMESLGRVQVMKIDIGSSMSFDLMNPETIAFLSQYTFNLIREISTDQRLAVQDIVMEAFRHGGHPYEQARDIRKMVGLTRTQAQAVRNFRSMLEGSPDQMRDALTRALRDRRFDPTVLNAVKLGQKLPKAKIDAMVDQYYSRYLTYRARNIARTETLRASHLGQMALWRQAQGQGLLPADRTRRKWIVAPGERTCERCKEIPKINEAGVRVDEPFVTLDGPIDGPPLHPSCRCTTGLTFLSRE